MIQKILFVAAACLLSAASADAQSGSRITIEQAAGARQEGSVRIQSSITLFMPGPTGEGDQAVAFRDRARRSIYEMAAKECDILRDVMARECRLESVNVNINRQQPGQQQQIDGYQVRAAMNLQITLK